MARFIRESLCCPVKGGVGEGEGGWRREMKTRWQKSRTREDERKDGEKENRGEERWEREAREGEG